MSLYCSFCKKAHDEVRKLIVGRPTENNKNHSNTNFSCRYLVLKISSAIRRFPKLLECPIASKNIGSFKQL